MRTRPIKASLFCTLLAPLAGCQGASQALSDQDVVEIRRIEQEYIKAILASDVEAILAQRTPDFVLMPQGSRLISGRDPLREAYRSTPIAFTLTPAWTEGRDGLAYDRGRWWGTWVSGSDTLRRTGKYVNIWRRQQDGSWLMALEMWNSDELQK